MNILYIGKPPTSRYTAAAKQVWLDAFDIALDGRYTYTLFDWEQPHAQQFDGVDTVVDTAVNEGDDSLIDIASAAGVKLWQATSVGVDHINVARFHELNLPLAHSPGSSSSIPLAEHALMFIMAFTKNLYYNRTDPWQRQISHELAGSVLGIIGLGASGRALAKRAAALGMRIMAIDILEFDQSVIDEYQVEFLGKPDQLHEMLAQIDYVSMHAPLYDLTRHMLDWQAFEQMKSSAVLINVARGSLVDETALVQALTTGQIRGAGLDVFETEPLPVDHPLQKLDNVILSPHCAGYTPETRRRRLGIAVENIVRLDAGQEILHLVTEDY